MKSINIKELSPLFRLKNPPKKLYYKGNLELLNMKKVAIVGSRKMSIYTKYLIQNLAKSLKNRGICVVSGGAIGCDAQAGISAFPNTIAVFGNGLEEIYPKTNEKLIKNIYDNALALSEYEPNTKASGFRFLERNRIVVGLCEALVVAQADFRSGSLQSARIANELKIPIYVFPHRINESLGTNFLLSQNKATLINDIEDFANKFGQNLTSTKSDELIEFIKQNPNFDEVYAKFGDLIYEYELNDRVEILGTKVILKC
ncbi:DNA-processing protein DprA [Campylobacter sp. FMV-PI01]|uniref:DNA-processing protein DprA n=1 Tax=Campylobacter portucalensis TaxID=2608384 RepID=A0A6L5WHQ4_9BACT|nr:DNA-processing protein DprA [Campylobacter portucalensis]MSN96720.1 DNA-processing protein DprA [Campylobacter portucalensis]